MPTLDTGVFKEITKAACEKAWKDLMALEDNREYHQKWERWHADTEAFAKRHNIDLTTPEGQCQVLKHQYHLEWGCAMQEKKDSVYLGKCAIGIMGNVEIEFPKQPMIGVAHYHPTQVELNLSMEGKHLDKPLKPPFASDEDVPEMLAEANTDLEKFRHQCIAMDTNTVCYDMKDWNREAWTQAVANVDAKYHGLISMPFVGKQMGLALMFEDLCTQGVVKKRFVRTGTKLKL